MRLLPCLTAAALVAGVSGCIDYLEPGTPGELRYFGEVRGEAPLDLIPPISDREGNVYVLFGAPDLNLVKVFVGHASGGWSSGCDLHKGDDRGAHGWLGRDENRAWYWSGDAVVEVSGRTGSCRRVLDRDPASNANLLFQGAAPIVRETPSRTYTLGLIQSPSDRLPFFVVVDLDLQRYTSVASFSPGDAEDVQVLGAGADPEDDVAFMVVRYQLAMGPVVEGLFLDMDGNVVGRAAIDGADDIAEDGIAGYLQSVDGNVVVGLVRATDTEAARLLVFSRGTRSGRVNAVDALTPVGLHRFEDHLYLVGENGDAPAIARLSTTGQPQSAVTWEASERFARNMRGDVRVLDDRSDPRRGVRWTDPVSAIGPDFFLSEHSPDAYALDTTGWLVAGPSFTVSGEPQTSVAFAPVGISYP